MNETNVLEPYYWKSPLNISWQPSPMNHVFYKKLDGCSCGSRGFIYLATWRAFLKYRPWRWYIDEELVKIFDDLMWFDDWDNQKYVKLGQLCSVEMQRFIFRRYFIIKLQCRYSTPPPKKKPRTQSYSWTFYFSLISVIFVVPGCFGVLSNFRLFELFLKDARFCCGISLYLTSVSVPFRIIKHVLCFL